MLLSILLYTDINHKTTTGNDKSQHKSHSLDLYKSKKGMADCSYFFPSLLPANHWNTQQTPKQTLISFLEITYSKFLFLTYYLRLNAVLGSSKLQISNVTSDSCSWRYSYSITAAEFNLLSALPGFTCHKCFCITFNIRLEFSLQKVSISRKHLLFLQDKKKWMAN